MKTITAALVAGWLGVASAGAQGQALFQNFGLLSFPPSNPIDAVRVINNGTISVSGFPLWDTQDTLHFSNNGLISGSVGFKFDYQPYFTALRYPLTGFTNQGRIIGSGDILVSATNLNNFLGTISSSRNGKVVLSATNGTLSLFNSSVGASDGAFQPNASEGGFFVNAPLYFNPNNVVDYYWGVGTGNGNRGLVISSLADRTFGFVNAGLVYRVDARGGIFIDSGELNFMPIVDSASPSIPGIPGYSYFVYTNLVLVNGSATPRIWREMVQMVFVQTNVVDSPGVRVYFQGGTARDNYAPRFVTVEFEVKDFDAISGQVVSRYVSLIDRSATNITQGVPAQSTLDRNDYHLDTFRPENYVVTRSDFPSFGTFGGVPFGDTPASDFDPNLIWHSPQLVDTNVGARFETNFVNHVFSAYQFEITPRNVPAGSLTALDTLTGFPVVDQLNDPTNSSGRVEIRAKNLDLGSAIVRAENTITIDAETITDLRGARLNAQHLNLRQTAPGGTFILSNTFPNSVSRMRGAVSVWTAQWQVDQLITNAPLGLTNVAFLGGNNTIQHSVHMMVVDLTRPVLDTFAAGGGSSSFFGTYRDNPMSTNLPTDLPRVNLSAANVEFHDTNTVTRQFVLNGDCWLIGSNAVFTMTDGLQTFSAANAPVLTCLTNLGTFTVPQQANFGFDRFDASFNPQPYSNIVNRGQISAGSLQARANYFENRSNLFAIGGSIFVNAQSNRLADGFIFSSFQSDFSGGDMVVTNTTINTGGSLNFSFTDRLTDSGLNNSWFTAGGVNFASKALKGDLLATRIYATAPTNLNSTLIWPAENRGDDSTGFLNNIGLGELVLDGAPNSLFRFRGAGLNNAIYISNLVLTNFTTNFVSGITVDPNITVYFANANVPGDKLTNAFPGRMVWMSAGSPLGPLVTVSASIATRITMPSSVLQSTLNSNRDVDDDGIDNEMDLTPLSGFTLNDVQAVTLPGSGNATMISWQGVAGWTYYLEARSSLGPDAWTLIKTVIPAVTGTVTEFDNQPSKSQRFYRVRYVRP